MRTSSLNLPRSPAVAYRNVIHSIRADFPQGPVRLVFSGEEDDREIQCSLSLPLCTYVACLVRNGDAKCIDALAATLTVELGLPVTEAQVQSIAAIAEDYSALATMNRARFCARIYTDGIVVATGKSGVIERNERGEWCTIVAHRSTGLREAVDFLKFFEVASRAPKGLGKTRIGDVD